MKNTDFLWALNCKELHFSVFATGIRSQFVTSLKLQWQWRK